MNRTISMLLVVAVVLVNADLCDAKVYKWKDENGKWHFTDDPGKLPQNQRSPLKQTTPKRTTRQPAKTDQVKKSDVDRKRMMSSHSSGKNFEQGLEEGFEKMGEALGKGLEAGMEKLGEELGKAFEGMGELMVIAELNKPDMEKKVFESKEEEVKHDVQQVLLGMFLICQFQYIVGKLETCSKDGLKEKMADGWSVNEDSEMKKKFEDYVIEVDPVRNTRKNLLIKAHHKEIGNVWEITHEGKKSIKESSEPAKKMEL